MAIFSGGAFGYTFSLVLSLSFAALLTWVGERGTLSLVAIVQIGMASFGIAIFAATFVGFFRLPLRWLRRAYFGVMRMLARRTIYASIAQVMIPVECLGIMEREGYVNLRLKMGSTDGIREGFPFKVLENTGNRLWGTIMAVSVDEYECLCIPISMNNENFWSSLESRMRFDPSPPSHVHFVAGYPSPMMEELIYWLLDNWR